MKSTRLRSVVAAVLVCAAATSARRMSATPRQPPAFRAHVIDTALAGGYQVVIADMNRDGKPDILAIATGLSDVRWYENPGWQKHVVVRDITAPINAAVYDVDGDGIPEIALAHDFSNVYRESIGTVSILTHASDLNADWTRRDIDRVPTSHRLRFVDIDGSGRKVLVNAPLIGAKAVAPEYRDHVPLLLYRPGAWTRETIGDADEGVVHGALPFTWGDATRESILTASFLGVFAHRYDNGAWKRTRIVSGETSAWPKSGSSDVSVGQLGAERFLATIEPWHGNEVVVYRHHDGDWEPHVIDSTIVDGHTIVVGDFAQSGRDEIIVGERGGKRSVYRYRLENAVTDTWSKTTLDAGGMAAAGCAVADINGDKRADVVCIGTATANLKWYENRP
jgi:hypothetical protein